MALELLMVIPDEFEREFYKNQFSESLQRLIADADFVAGGYEKETATMLIQAFKNAKYRHLFPGMTTEDDTDKLIEQMNTVFERLDRLEAVYRVICDGNKDERVLQ